MLPMPHPQPPAHQSILFGVGLVIPIGVQMSRRRGIPGLSFSWKRALGVSQAQARLSLQIGIPLSRSGRQRKIGRSLGCCWVLLVPVAGWVVSRFLAG